MLLETLIREGAEPLTPDELRTLDKVRTHHELYRALDHATIGGGDAVGDRAIRKAFGAAARAIRLNVRKNYPKMDQDELEAEVLLQAFDAVANWTKAQFNGEDRPRTPGAYRAYVERAMYNRLATAGKRVAKERAERMEEPLFDMVERRTTPYWDEGELIAKFAEFFAILTEPDQLILTPLPFTDVPILEWPWRSAVDVLDRFKEDEERARQLSDCWNVHPGDVFRRLEILHGLWKDFLRKGTDAFNHYHDGPSWLNENRPGPKPKSGRTGNGHQGPRGNCGSDPLFPRTKRPRRRDNPSWASPTHRRFNAGVSR